MKATHVCPHLYKMPRVGRSTETKSSTGRWGWELVLRVDRVSSARRRRMGLHSSVSALNTTDLHTYLHLRLYIYVTYILPHTAEGIILRTPTSQFRPPWLGDLIRVWNLTEMVSLPIPFGD